MRMILVFFIVLPNYLNGITINTDSKKESKAITEIEKDDLLTSSSGRINVTERQRRLIPYMTFYLSSDFNRPSNHIQELMEQRSRSQQQYRVVPQKVAVQPYSGKIVIVNQVPKYSDPPPVIYQSKIRYNPFLESNKLPGGFTPIRNPHPIRVQVLNAQQQSPATATKKAPEYSSIFDKLLQLKQLQYEKRPQYEYENPKINIATQYYTREYVTQRPNTKIVAVENYPPIQPTKTYIHTYTPSNIDIPNDNKVQNYENFESLKTYNQIPAPVPVKEYEPVIPIKNYQTQSEEPQFNQQPHMQNDQIIIRPMYQPIPIKNYHSVYEQAKEIPVTENPHSLSVILKQLQDSNTLPQTLTPDNIDNSIKTLVQILNALKQTEKFQKPILVTPTDDATNVDDDYDDEELIPETIHQKYPANTPEGGTPGKPGIDYPAYSYIPQTNFNCKKQRYKGFFGDPDTSCQVWHYCDLNGGQASFLCPNGTIFSQVALTCDWWYNVKCATTTQLYVLNERLYKYILPFTPKFPEDYSGPLVDRYLALKFKEMEEKMKKQKKNKYDKATTTDSDPEINNLQDIQEESEEESESIAESREQTTRQSVTKV